MNTQKKTNKAAKVVTNKAVAQLPVWDRVESDWDSIVVDSELLAGELAVCGIKTSALVVRGSLLGVMTINYGLDVGMKVVPAPDKLGAALDNLFTSK